MSYSSLSMPSMPVLGSEKTNVKVERHALVFPELKLTPNATHSSITTLPTFPSFPTFPTSNHAENQSVLSEIPPLAAAVSSIIAEEKTEAVLPIPPPLSNPPLLKEEPRSAPKLDYSDHDLLDAFRPLVEEAVNRALFLPDGGMDTYLEPMLRSTIRRALAEQNPTQRPFQEPSIFDRAAWKTRALFTSKTYEEVVFEKTRRFRVEEVYLLEKKNLSLISYASADPARHSSARRVQATVQLLADKALEADGSLRLFFELFEGRHGVVRQGKNSILIAIILGHPNDGLRIDLDYTLRRVEERYAEKFDDLNTPLLLPIQPHLEDCLLIHAPSSHF